MFASAELLDFEQNIIGIVTPIMSSDPAHDLQHVARVVKTAKRIAVAEGTKTTSPFNLVAAAWMHDIVIIEKSSSETKQAGEAAADEALNLLLRQSLNHLVDVEIVHDAIRCHNFSAGLTPSYTEGLILQDADRLDAIGAIGVARCFSVGARIGAQFYDHDEPVPNGRSLDDKSYSIDHFYKKLFKLSTGMNTAEGSRLAARRDEFMQQFITQFLSEVAGDS